MTQNVCSSGISDKKTITSSCRTRSKHRHKTQFEWLVESYNSVLGETALWRAVITQAMMDALSRAGNAEAAYHKHEAINWLTGNSRDFVIVCLFAGFDPDYVRRRAKRALASPTPWRAAAGKGKRYVERKAYRTRVKQQREHESAASPVAEVCIIAGPWAITA